MDDSPGPLPSDLHSSSLEESEADERRRAERYLADLPVAFRVGDARRTHRARCGDIAELGLCVRSRSPVELGTELALEVEVIMPTRVRLGYDLDALVIDGPNVSHFATLKGLVRRIAPHGNGTYSLGIEFQEQPDTDALRVVDMYLDHLRDNGHSQFL